MVMYEKEKEPPAQKDQKKEDDTRELLVEQFSTVTLNLKNTIQETLKDVTTKLVQLKGQLAEKPILEPETNEQKMKLSLMKRQL